MLHREEDKEGQREAVRTENEGKGEKMGLLPFYTPSIILMRINKKTLTRTLSRLDAKINILFIGLMTFLSLYFTGFDEFDPLLLCDTLNPLLHKI